MSFKDIGERLDKGADEAKKEVSLVKSEVSGLSKTTKYIMYSVLVLLVLSLGCCTLKGCGNKNAPVGQQGFVSQIPSEPTPELHQTLQPQIQQQGYAPQSSGLTTGESMALGALGGYVIGKTLMPNGQVYQGTPQQQTIVKNYYIQHPKEAQKMSVNNSNKQSVPTAAAVAPVAPVKVKNPGDIAVEQARKQDQLKADLKAKQFTRATTPIKSSGGFKSFSQNASRSSSSSSRRR